MKTIPLRSLWRITPVFCTALACPIVAHASSHSDAPLIKQDPQANLTDLYAFIGTKYDNPAVKVLNVLVSVRPFSEPGDGVIYERFADNARYSIHLTNPVTGQETRRFDFVFSKITDVKNPDTILSYGRGTEVGPITTIGDGKQNFTQTYVFTESAMKGKSKVLKEQFESADLPVSPPNVGARTTPAYNGPDGKAVSGAVDFAGLDSLTKQAVTQLGNGIVAWAGPREDGFYADTPGIFDFLDPRIIGNDSGNGLGQDGGGVDGFKGFNVLSYAIQIPLTQLEAVAFTNPFLGAQSGVGVYASVSRQAMTMLSAKKDPKHSGKWVQVNRLGNPLFNEVLVALRGKDVYNRTSPVNDATAFKTYAENPEVAFLINAVLFADPEGDGPLATTGRTDLAAVFIPDVLRVDTTTDPVKLPGQAGFNRLSVIGGDTGGWPNGRRVGDDVVDIALSAVASGPAYTSITVVGDNVSANDQIYNQVFPYLATPHAGPAVDQRQAPSDD
ncbi:DUF4331 domain-containing protein [Luteolibacter arcticus]|uniref:DUF4331 domain-containing protein n=1 Tax=Luteolibacter arcticus TaxID=1581411 RepID=A0ABT3GQ13_9BACT|nr:DUF4331 domain-containing protein [Luteolibacter arcticus]MCW1925617.1 DUF4331 domain-containing protein [Luteolibacter arcticus]